MHLVRLAVAAVAVTLSLGAATAAECELPSTTAIFKKIDLTPSLPKCVSVSGFSLNPPPAKFTTAQLDKLCAIESCRSAVSSIASMQFPSCTISMLNGINLRVIFDAISSHCGKKAATNSSKQSALSPALATTTSPSVGAKVSSPATTQAPASFEGNSASSPSASAMATTTAPKGSSPAIIVSAGAPAAAAEAKKPNLRKNCHS